MSIIDDRFPEVLEGSIVAHISTLCDFDNLSYQKKIAKQFGEKQQACLSGVEENKRIAFST